MRKHLYWVVLLLTLLSSCHSAQYHFDKFQQKGGKVNCITDTLIVNDTIVIDGDTVIVPREHYIVRDSIHYVTKWETKYKYKTLKVEHKTAQIEEKEETKRKKEEEKTIRNESDNDRKKGNGGKWWKGLLLGLVIGFILGFLARFLIKLYIKR